MLNKKYKLKRNPFYHKFIRNELEIEKFPFVETQSYKRILREINLFYQNNPDEFLSFLGVVVGSTGSGKTTCMLRIQKELRNQQKSVAFINVLKKSPVEYYRFITGSYNAYSPKFKEAWTTNNSVLIFDVPDGAKSRQIAKIVDVIQQVFSEYHTSMIFVCNQNQYSSANAITTIFNKFELLSLKPFDINETKELVYKRLNGARVPGFDGDNDFHPFTEDIIQHIFNIANGNPRYIVNMCKNLLNSGKSLIDESVIIEIGEKDYVIDVLKSRFSDPSDITVLKKLFDIMVEKYDGFVPSQQEIAKEVNKQYGWDKKTVVRRLKNLIRVGLVIERRNADDQWRKEYLVRTRIPV